MCACPTSLPFLTVVAATDGHGDISTVHAEAAVERKAVEEAAASAAQIFRQGVTADVAALQKAQEQTCATVIQQFQQGFAADAAVASLSAQAEPRIATTTVDANAALKAQEKGLATAIQQVRQGAAPVAQPQPPKQPTSATKASARTKASAAGAPASDPPLYQHPGLLPRTKGGIDATDEVHGHVTPRHSPVSTARTDGRSAVRQVASAPAPSIDDVKAFGKSNDEKLQRSSVTMDPGSVAPSQAASSAVIAASTETVDVIDPIGWKQSAAKKARVGARADSAQQAQHDAAVYADAARRVHEEAVATAVLASAADEATRARKAQEMVAPAQQVGDTSVTSAQHDVAAATAARKAPKVARVAEAAAARKAQEEAHAEEETRAEAARAASRTISGIWNGSAATRATTAGALDASVSYLKSLPRHKNLVPFAATVLDAASGLYVLRHDVEPTQNLGEAALVPGNTARTLKCCMPPARAGHVLSCLRATGRAQLLPWGVIFDIASGVAGAMAVLHSLTPPRFHGGIRPSNVLLSEAELGTTPPMIALDVAAAVLLGDPSTMRSAQGDLRDYGFLLVELLGGSAGAGTASLPAACPAALVRLIDACLSPRPPKLGNVLRALRHARADIDASLLAAPPAAPASAAASFVSSAVAAAAAPIGWLSRLASSFSVQPVDPAVGLVADLQRAVAVSPAAVLAVFATLPGPSGWKGFASAGGAVALHKVLTAHGSNVLVALGGCVAAQRVPHRDLVPLLAGALKRHPGTDVAAAACSALLVCASSPWAQSNAAAFEHIAAPLSSMLRSRTLRQGTPSPALLRAAELVGGIALLGGAALAGLLSTGVVSSLVDAASATDASPAGVSACLHALSTVARQGKREARAVAVGGARLAARAARGELAREVADGADPTIESGVALLVVLASSGDRHACEAAAAVDCVPIFMASSCLGGDIAFAIRGLATSGQAAAVTSDGSIALALADAMASRDMSDDDVGAAAQTLDCLFNCAAALRCTWDREALLERLGTCLAVHGARLPPVELSCARSLLRLVHELREPTMLAASPACATRVITSLAMVVQRHVKSAATVTATSALCVAAQALAQIARDCVSDREAYVELGGAAAMSSALRHWKQWSWDASIAADCFDALGALVSSPDTKNVCAGIDAGALEWSVSSVKGEGPGSIDSGLAVLARLTLWAAKIMVVDSALLERISSTGGIRLLSQALASHASATDHTTRWGPGVVELCTRALAAVVQIPVDCIEGGLAGAAVAGAAVAARFARVAEELRATELSDLPTGTKDCSAVPLAADERELQWMELCKAVCALAQRDAIEASCADAESSESSPSSSSALGPDGGGTVARALQCRSRCQHLVPAADAVLVEALGHLLARSCDLTSAVDAGVICELGELVRSRPYTPALGALYAAIAKCLAGLATQDSFAAQGGLAACDALLRIADAPSTARAAVDALLSWLGVEMGSSKPRRLTSCSPAFVELHSSVAAGLCRCLGEFRLDAGLASAACTALDCIAGASRDVVNSATVAALLVLALGAHPESAALATPALSIMSSVVVATRLPPDEHHSVVRVTVEAMRRFGCASGCDGQAVAEAGACVLSTFSQAIDFHDVLAAAIVEALSSAARVHGTSLIIASACCSVLSRIALGASESENRGNSGTIAAFFDAGGCTALSNELWAHAARMTSTLASAVCVALARLAGLRRKAVFDTGAPLAAVAAVRGHAKSADVAGSALQLLLDLFCKGEGCGRSLDASELAAVCLALGSHADKNPSVCVCGVGLIGHGLDGSYERSSLALGSGATPALVSALSHTRSSSGAFSCLKAVRVLAGTHPKAVIAAQAPRAIAAAISLHVKTCECRGSGAPGSLLNALARAQMTTRTTMSRASAWLGQRRCWL